MKKISERLDKYILQSLLNSKQKNFKPLSANQIKEENKEHLKVGSLYSTLNRMVKDGTISRIKFRNTKTGRLQHPSYEITQVGENYLEGLLIIAKNDNLKTGI